MPDTNTVDMATVDVVIPVESHAAEALKDPALRAMAGRLISRMVQPADVQGLFDTMDALSAEAARRGLTDEILEEELAAYNAERRGGNVPPE